MKTKKQYNIFKDNPTFNTTFALVITAFIACLLNAISVHWIIGIIGSVLFGALAIILAWFKYVMDNIDR